MASPTTAAQRGSGYKWHRENSTLNLEAQRKRNQWLAEVAEIKREKPDLKHPEALRLASQRRKARNPEYKTLKERTAASRKGRQYKKSDGTLGKFRPAGPYRKRNKTPMTINAATKHLRAYYRDRLRNPLAETGSARPQSKTGRVMGAMRRDISSKRQVSALKPCSTKTTTYRRRNPHTGEIQTITRRISVKSKDCQDSWLYRSRPTHYDIQGVDNGIGQRSPAYNSRLQIKTSK